MNTSQIKSFAIESRKVLKAGVMNRIQALGFSAEGEPTMGQPTKIQGATVFAGRMFEESFYEKWMGLYERIQRKGVKEVYEEAAYTWFNRLVAIRIMQKNGFIEPVLAYSSEETRIPRIVAEARAGRLPHQMSSEERSKLIELLSDDTKVNEQFALLIENFCKTNPVIFNCFGGIEQYISLLLPDNILVQGGFIDLLNHTSYISDDDYKQSELIGWLYQFYISEKKDEVFDSFKNGKKAEAEDIPAATQIFTPNWIVKYMVQNTIGRIYLDNNPYSGLAESMKYLVKTEEPTPEESILHIDDLVEYKMIDPACGSGHILVEGFDLFFQMYKEEGYASHAAIENIFWKNLIGIDLDTRAKQLATFALLMKAARIDQSFLDCKIMPRVLDMPRPCTEFKYDLTNTLSQFFMSTDKPLIDETLKAFELLKQADNLGSIMKFDMLSGRTRAEIALRYKEIAEFSNVSDQIKEILPSIQLVLALTDKYTAVVANPPYMGAGNMNTPLTTYVKKEYNDAKSDLFSVFYYQCINLVTSHGKIGIITLPSWMFLSSFTRYRFKVISELHFDSFLHLGRGIFGIDWGSTAFITTKASFYSSSIFFKLHKRIFQHIYYFHIEELFRRVKEDHTFKYDFDNYRDEDGVVSNFSPISSSNGTTMYYIAHQSKFLSLPENPIAYWVAQKDYAIIESNTSLGEVSEPRAGLQTSDNNRFLRNWQEIDFRKIGIGLSREEALSSDYKWFPHNKGGDARKWYGNRNLVINFYHDGEELKYWLEHNPSDPTTTSWSRNLRNYPLYFNEGLTWNAISSNISTVRFSPMGSLFDTSGPMLFGANLLYILGYTNSVVFMHYIGIFSQSLSTGSGHFSNVPYILLDNHQLIDSVVDRTIIISKLDWDAHETSWDFQKNELIRMQDCCYGNVADLDLLNPEEANEIKARYNVPTNGNLLSDCYKAYKSAWDRKFNNLHYNEEELNRIFIEIYGLQDELTPEVPLDEITILQQGEISIENNAIVWHPDVIMKQLLSYAVGCMMGRYRLDKPGLAIAYPNPSAEDIAPYEYNGMTFNIDDDGIIPLMDRSCPFEDNAYNRTVKFIKQVFGEENQNENLNFLETSLGTSIENYLVKDFWKDHKKMYQNRPIYWLFSSKKGAFQCLVYMHRMNAYTAETVRSKYLLPYIDYLKTNIANQTEHASLLSTVDRKALTKMQKDLDECLEYEERLHDVADRQIAFDLDDGVVVNYAKFGDVLAKIK